MGGSGEWRVRVSWLAIGIAGLLTGPARAADGVLEISRACAAGSGCFSGDAPGYPVEISGLAGRSYRLTSDLRLDAATGAFDQNTSAIVVSTNDVTIDLGGFLITGPCNSGSCSGVGTGDGIATTGFLRGIEVRNGTVAYFGRHGVRVPESSVVRDLRSFDHRGAGLVIGAGSLVFDSVADRNGAEGILFGDGSRVSGNSVRNNFGPGIAIAPPPPELVAVGGVIERNTVAGNVGDGILTGRGALVADNAVTQNQGNGISVGAGSSVVRNTVLNNGVGPGGDDGVRVEAGSSVRDNTVRLSLGFGLVFVGPSAYAGNVFSSNQGGTVSGSGTNLGGNACDVPPDGCP